VISMASNTVDKSKLLENTELDKYILSFKRDVPNFYDDDICDVILVPVEGGTIRVFHHKPKNVRSQRPIVFIPGFGTATQSWRDFHFTHHGDTEYYHIESREKISANIKRDKKADLSIDRLAKDIAAVIDFVGLTNSDYVLVGTCMAGGVLLYGAISQILQPPTMIAFDPFTKWT